jgi:ABC-type glycerol-3-phosphate transport system substrate-binding protein
MLPPATTGTGTAPAAISPTPDRLTLRLWLPPQFAPQGSSVASKLLKARLNEYLAGHPGIDLDIRIKGSADSPSMLDAISLTRSAAPAILPDLAALSRLDLEAAALKGMLHPLGGLSEELDSPDWYLYARESGRVQNVDYGLPFAGDALGIVYHPSAFEQTPATWDELFARRRSLAMVTGDPDSLLLLDLYLSTGTALVNSANQPQLEQGALQRVLELVQAGNVVPLQSEDAVWSAFVDGRADMGLVWASRFLREPDLDDSALMPLPSLDGQPFVLATTWAWALAGSNSRNDEAAAELAKWLTAEDFIAQWDLAAGYLPPRPTALQAWPNSEPLDLISQSAEVMPGDDLLTLVGPILQDALDRTLRGEVPEEVARSAAEALK